VSIGVHGRRVPGVIFALKCPAKLFTADRHQQPLQFADIIVVNNFQFPILDGFVTANGDVGIDDSRRKPKTQEG
jgi:hypothetical protein